MKLRITWRSLAVGLLLAVTTAAQADLRMSETLLPVSKGALALGEWNNNFNGALAIADAHHVPLLVFYGGLSCGKCEELQRACLTDEFLAWQREHRMLMVFTTNNALGDASGFAKPLGSTGFPFIAVYWNRAGDPPQKDTASYRTFNGRDGEMLVKGGTLAGQLIGSIETVVSEYDFSSSPDISERAELLYSEPVTTSTRYDVRLFTGFDVALALAPQPVYNLVGRTKPVVKRISGKLPRGLRLAFVDGALVLSGTAKKAGSYQYEISIQQRRNGVLHAGPSIVFAFTVIAANDASQGGCAMLGRSIKATVPLMSSRDGAYALGTLEIVTSARNRAKAKFTGLASGKAVFSGAWTGIEERTAFADLSARGGRLSLELAGDGRIKAVLTLESLSAPLESPDGLKVGVGTYCGTFAGPGTATLTEDARGGSSVVSAKITSGGRVRWGVKLGNGKKLSGTAFAMLDADGGCVVPILKSSARSYVSAVLKIPPSGSQGMLGPFGEARALWGDAAYPASQHACTVNGGRQ